MALEHAEAALMRGTLQRPIYKYGRFSHGWAHDAILVHTSIPAEYVQADFVATAAVLDLPHV